MWPFNPVPRPSRGLFFEQVRADALDALVRAHSASRQVAMDVKVSAVRVSLVANGRAQLDGAELRSLADYLGVSAAAIALKPRDAESACV